VTRIYLLLGIAGLILIVACINFMNLSMARFARRAKEVGLRKVVGANRIQLVKQFLTEAFFLTFVALVLAVVIVELCLPPFQVFLEKKLDFGTQEVGIFVLVLVGVWLFVGAVSGGFPAFVASSLHPIDTLKGTLTSGPGSVFFRRALVVFQFAVSIGLIIATVVVYQQQAYMRSQKLGFEKEQVITFSLRGFLDERSRGPRDVVKLESLKQALLRQASVLGVTSSSSVPGKEAVTFFYTPTGAVDAETRQWTAMFVDIDFIDIYDIELLKGRNFSKNLTSDKRSSMILNEEGVRVLALNDPIGQKRPAGFGIGIKNDASVIGVVKDFHLQSLHEQIGPVVIVLSSTMSQYVSIRFHTADVSALLEFLEHTWAQFAPGYPFVYTFLDDDFDQLYRAEVKLTQVFGFFSFWAILIAGLGLFGLAFFEIDRRAKEIGIRKVLGASVSHLAYLLSKEFLYLLLFANVIAWPVVYHALAHWLQSFPYRIELHIGLFLLGGISAFCMAFMVVAYQAVKAAHTNPVDTLRSE